MCFGTISNTNVFINGRRIGGCCTGFGWNNWGGCGFNTFTPGCFGYGFGCGGGGFEMGAGIGLGYAAGMTFLPLVPKLIGGVCKGVKNLWQKIFPPKEAKTNAADK